MSSSIVMGEGVLDALGGNKKSDGRKEARKGEMHGKGVSTTEWPRLESRKSEKGKLYDG